MDYYLHIKEKILEQLDKGNKKFILYPYGKLGVLTKKILNDVFDIKESYIIDNEVSKYNRNVNSLDFLRDIEISDNIVLITSDNEEIYEEVRSVIREFVDDTVIVDLFEKNRLKKIILIPNAENTVMDHFAVIGW